jgi:hypothetical protein
MMVAAARTILSLGNEIPAIRPRTTRTNATSIILRATNPAAIASNMVRVRAKPLIFININPLP